MKPAAKRVFTLLALPAIALVLGGCGGVAVSGRGYTSVYGDYGYVGPWDSGGVEVEGGYFVAPPYGRSGGDRRDEDSRRREAAAPERGRTPERPAPVQHAAPVQRAAPRPIPSIPNNPRPAPQRGGNDKTKR
jgi:phage tail tape-measure protein